MHRKTKLLTFQTQNTMKTKQQINTYSKSEINRNFKIKVFGIVNGVKRNTLVGVSGLINILNGDEAKAMAMVTRAFNSGKDRTDCKIYGGAKVSFYVF